MVIILGILFNIWGAQTRSCPVLAAVHELSLAETLYSNVVALMFHVKKLLGNQPMVAAG